MVGRARRGRARVHVRRARLAQPDARPRARRGRDRDSVPTAGNARSAASLDRPRRPGARRRAVVHRGNRPGRRALPSRADPEARRLRLALAARGGRVQGRRAAPGYAFPLWHGWLALVAKLAAVDPSSVVLHESSILAPLALVLAFEAGRAVFRSASLAFATMLVFVSVMAFAPGGGGSYGARAAGDGRAAAARARGDRALLPLRQGTGPPRCADARGSGHVARVRPPDVRALPRHPARRLRARARAPRTHGRARARALLAFGLPVVLVFAWLLPIVRRPARTILLRPSCSAG